MAIPLSRDFLEILFVSPRRHFSRYRPLMRCLAVIALLAATTACGPRSYGQCIKAAEAKHETLGSIRTLIGTTSEVVMLMGDARKGSLQWTAVEKPALEAWAECCELPGVYREDEQGCTTARTLLK